MTSSDSQVDKPQCGRPKRAELPDVNINTGAQSITTERAGQRGTNNRWCSRLHSSYQLSSTNSMHADAIEDEGESRYKITDIIGELFPEEELICSFAVWDQITEIAIKWSPLTMEFLKKERVHTL